MKLRPLRNNVMFKFLDDTAGEKGVFTDTHRSGIIIPRSTKNQKVHRWAEVVALGPDAEAGGLCVGDFILIEALMWMEGVKFEGSKVWKTDDSKVLAVTNDRAACQSQAL